MDYIGIDYGSKHIGLSWGTDELGIAVPLNAIVNFSTVEDVFSSLKVIAFEKGCQAFVLGLPLHMDGTEGVRVQEVRKFAKKLAEAFSKPIYFQDERLSTQATQYLSLKPKQALRPFKKQKARGIIDSQAATIILQDFLDQKAKS